MSYTLVTVPAARQGLKKLPKPVREYLIQALEVLKENPHQGEPLERPWQAFRSFHTKYNNVSYRVIYEVDRLQKLIILHYAATRENFYKELRRLRLKPLGNS
jgi:mRNA-degrading endonuclease RelE of RelBE toxin-antitoxin system